MGINTFPQPASSPYTAGTTFGPQSSRPTSPSIGQSFYNGDLATFEIWNGSTWGIANSAPASVTSVTPTDSGSGRAYNNGRTSVAFTPATVGGLATLYTVVSSPSAYTASGTSSPILITGMQTNTSYTYSVIASNAVGASAGLISAPVTATTIPTPAGTPTAALISDGTGNITVSWAASATGGAGTTTSYQVTSSPGAITTSTTSTSATMTGFTSATAYTFTVVASNANGSAAASAASNSVISLAGPAMNYLVVGGGASSFSNSNAAGGGGAVKQGTNTVFGTSFTITVGAAGTAGTVYSGGSHAAAQGKDSQLATVIAKGGGAGGYAASGSIGNGIAGGNGGGGMHYATSGTASGGASNDNGYAGGSVDGNNSYYPAAGGGGGAAGAGSGVNGGHGIPSSITGTQIYYGPGGGGGVYSNTGVVGIDGMTRNTPSPVRPNNGAGCGSGLYQGSGTCSGSAGIVVIQYPTTSRAMTSIPGTLTYTVSSANGYYTYIFTAGTGTVTW